MENNPSTLKKSRSWLRDSLGAKLAAIAFLILILIIPVSMIEDLIWERQNRQDTVINEVSRDWSGPQTLVGPILSIPYSKWVEYDDNKRREEKHVAHFLPTDLKINGHLAHQIRKRGIFEAVLYQASGEVLGTFNKPNFDALHVSPEDIHWDQAKVSVGISGMTGIKEIIELKWGNSTQRTDSGTAYPSVMNSGVSTPVSVQKDTEKYDFSFPFKVNGSRYFHLEPVGKMTSVNLTSDWHSPSFDGAFLPDQREISPEGFSAQWQILDLNRNYPQQWKDNEYNLLNQSRSSGFGFGVTLLQPVGEYLKNTRSLKYALMVIGLTFLIFFFFEVLRKLLIHPFQYLLIGLALAVFYLLLLSLSEHFGFNTAYLVASAATVTLISGYSLSVLKIKNLVIQLTLLLIAIYGFIFIILQLEDFALLAGSIGVFIALAATMFYSRKVDWYNLARREEN